MVTPDPYNNNFGDAQIVSNTYTNGEGVIEFDRPLTAIGNYAFYNCTGLTSVEFGSMPYIASAVFINVYCSKNIALTDSSYIYLDNNPDFPQMQSASYTRQMTNEWGTLVLPFGIDYLPENGNYRLYCLERVENQNLLLSEYAEGNLHAPRGIGISLFL